MAIGSDLIFSDNFDRADDPTSLGPEYAVHTTIVDGTAVFGIAANRAQMMSATSEGVHMFSVPPEVFGGADYQIETAVAFASGVPVGVVLRLSNPGPSLSGYFVCVHGAGTQCFRFDGGVETQIAAYEYHGILDGTATPWHLRFGVETVNGDVVITIEYRDGGGTYTLLRTITDSSEDRLLAAGTAGGAVRMSYDAENLVSWDYLTITGTAAGSSVPEFTDGPTATDITASGFSVGATSSKAGVASLLVTEAGAEQPDDADFDASDETAIISAGVPFSIAHTGETGGELREAWVQIKDAEDNRATDSVRVLLPTDGWQMVQLSSVNDDADRRLESTPDLEAGDFVQWGDIQGTGTVAVNEDASFDASSPVTGFSAAAGDLEDGWGAVALQTLNDTDTTPPSLDSAEINSAGRELTLTLDEAAAIGSDGGDGITLTASGGPVTAAYIDVAGNSIVYDLSRRIRASETVTVSYEQPGDGITDTAGNPLASFTDRAVTNNSTYEPSEPGEPSSGVLRSMFRSPVRSLVKVATRVLMRSSKGE